MSTPVTFADISHHQATVDVAIYARTHTAVVLKATEGTGFLDPAFIGRWELAGRLGLTRGAYHYADTTEPAGAQADLFCQAVSAASGLAPGDALILDVEDDSTPAAVSRGALCAAEFTARMVEIGHPTGVLYTGRWYADPAGITPFTVPAGWRQLWLADYTTDTDAAMLLPSGWDRSHVVARQYTNKGTAPGIVGPVDLSRVLEASPLFGGSMAAPTGPELARSILSALADTADTGQFGNNLWQQLVRIGSEGAKTQTAPLAAQIAAAHSLITAISNVIGTPTTGATLAAVLDTIGGQPIVRPVLADADVDRIATAVITRLAAGITLTVTPATAPAPTPAGQATP